MVDVFTTALIGAVFGLISGFSAAILERRREIAKELIENPSHRVRGALEIDRRAAPMAARPGLYLRITRDALGRLPDVVLRDRAACT